MAGQPILLDEPLRVQDMLDGKAFTFKANFDDFQGDDESDNDETDYTSKLTGQLDNINLEDEDLYEYNQGMFEDIAKLMQPVDKDGFVMKRIFRAGKGDVIPQNCKVTYHYKAFQEFEPIAFDSTYIRKKPEVSKIYNVIYGLGIALQSMRVYEKAQFLIKPEWAYGKPGILSRVPPNSTILFEVELISFVPLDVNDTDETEFKDMKDFTKNYQKALQLCAEAKHLITVEKKEKPAIRNYNEAIRLLTNVTLENADQEKEYVTLLIRLNTNLAISYNRLEHWPKTCLKCQEVYKLSQTFSRFINDKVFYNHAKALYGLREFHRADKQLRKAAKNASYDRPNTEIMNLYKKIQLGIAEANKAEANLAKAMLKKESPKVTT